MREPGPGATTGRPTINDVARLAGVSKKTVSRVINHSPHVQDATRKAVRAVIEETGYVPDPHARSLALGRALLVGLVYERTDLADVMALQQGLLDGLEGSGFELVVRCVDRNALGLGEDLRAFVEGQKLSGLVFAPSLSGHEDWDAWQGLLNCRCLAVPAAEARELGDLGRAAALRLTGAPHGTAPDPAR